MVIVRFKLPDEWRDPWSSGSQPNNCNTYAAQAYDKAQAASGYKQRVQFLEDRKTEKHRHDRGRRRSRKVIGFNLPYNKAVKTRIGRKFLHLIDKHFPKGSKIKKIFNLHNVKVR